LIEQCGFGPEKADIGRRKIFRAAKTAMFIFFTAGCGCAVAVFEKKFPLLHQFLVAAAHLATTPAKETGLNKNRSSPPPPPGKCISRRCDGSVTVTTKNR
jgi:hypothetical protein